jgi:hypothetical protein
LGAGSVASVRDNENLEFKARRHAVDLLPHRARITIDINISQLPIRCFSILAAATKAYLES